MAAFPTSFANEFGKKSHCFIQKSMTTSVAQEFVFPSKNSQSVVVT